MLTNTRTSRLSWLLILCVLALTAVLANPRTANGPRSAAAVPQPTPQTVADLDSQTVIDLGW